jgi:hypothetical protein
MRLNLPKSEYALSSIFYSFVNDRVGQPRRLGSRNY